MIRQNHYLHEMDRINETAERYGRRNTGAILLCAMLIGLSVLGLVFSAEIAAVMTPVRLAFLLGTFFGIFVGVGILGFVSLANPCAEVEP